MAKLIFRPENCIPPSKASHSFDRVELRPGVNNLSDAEYARLLIHPVFQSYIDCGAVEWIAEADPLSPVGDIPPQENQSQGSNSTVEKLDINAATSEELQALKFIGRAAATRIIDNRPYASLDELPAKAKLSLSAAQWSEVAGGLQVKSEPVEMDK